MTLPLAAGILSGFRLLGMLVALGAVWAASNDGLDRWRGRSRRIAEVAIASGAEMTLGAYAAHALHSALALAAVLVAVCVAAGWLQTARGHEAGGMHLLLGAIVGAGLDLKQPPPLLVGGAVTLGALLVLAAAAASDYRSVHHDGRVILAQAFDALAALATRPDSMRARRVVVDALNLAEDTVGSRCERTRAWSRERGGAARIRGRMFVRTQSAGRDAEALAGCLSVAVQVAEVVSVLGDVAGTGIGAETRSGVGPDLAPPGEECARVLTAAATDLRQRSATVALERLALAAHELDQSADAVLRRFADALSESERDEAGVAAPRRASGAATATPTVTPTATAPAATPTRTTPLADRLRFCALLSCGVAAAIALSHAINGPHAYWLPVSVAFIFRPDLGPVANRAAARTAGTVVGVALSALVLRSGAGSTAVLLAACAAFAAVMPSAARRGYAFAVASFTPIIFVFLSILGGGPVSLLPRITDTALAGAIVFVLDLVLWSRAPALRPDRQLATALEAAERYAELQDAADADPSARHDLRREAYRAVAQARTQLAHASAEPHPHRKPPVEVRAGLDEAETRIVAVTRNLVGTDGREAGR